MTAARCERGRPVGSYRLLVGGALASLRSLPAESVQCCVTSPPYWGLRDYGHADQIGLERTPEEYVAKLVAVFAEVRRVLRDDGVLWLNLGDCYATGAGRAGKHTAMAAAGPMTQPNRLPLPGLKPKDLIGIPWRVAFALQADGWWLRSENIWAKPNPMPSSVTDRTTVAHEQIFMLAKSERYYFDGAAIAEDAVSDRHKARNMRGGTSAFRGQASLRPRGKNEVAPGMLPNGSHSGRAGFNERRDAAEAAGETAPTRNKRTVWIVATQPYSGAHFATMPEALVEPCVLAGSAIGNVVLDPFAGSGTVGVVALRRGREFIGCELNPDYAQLARERIEGDAPLLNKAGTPPSEAA